MLYVSNQSIMFMVMKLKPSLLCFTGLCVFSEGERPAPVKTGSGQRQVPALPAGEPQTSTHLSFACCVVLPGDWGAALGEGE